MEEGTLIRWLKNVGDPVELNEPIMEIETDKITMEAEAPATGYLIATLAEENTVVPVLKTIGWIGEKDELPPPETDTAADAGKTESIHAGGAATVAEDLPGDGIAATPYARKLAAEQGTELSSLTATGKHGEIVGADVKISPVAALTAKANGVDLSVVNGTGFNGKIMKADVLRAIGACRRAEAHAESRQRMSSMRKVIADRMLKSVSEIPSAVLFGTADVTELLSLRAHVNDSLGKEKKVSINDFVCRAVAMALSDDENFRKRIEGNELVSFNYVNLGVAVSVTGGLLVPVVEDADSLTLLELSAKIKDLAARAKNGRLSPDEMHGSCFTVSSLGNFGVDFSTPIINQPDSAILGVGGIKDVLYLDDGAVKSRKEMGLSLSFDHRINDGVPAAQFLARIRGYLQDPYKMLTFM